MKRGTARFARFCATGALNTGVHLAAVALLHGRLAVPLLAANAAAFLVANLVSFVTNARWTFSTAAPWRRYPRFLLVSLWALAVSTGCVALARHLGLHWAAGIAAGAVVSALIGYAGSARLVFRERDCTPHR